MIAIEELKVIVKSLIISNQNVTTIQRLQREFREHEGYNMPLYGYFDVQDLLINGLSGAVKVFGCGPKAIVSAVLNNKVQHIHNLVSEQKKTRPRKRSSKPMNKRNSANANSLRYGNNFSRRQYSTAPQLSQTSSQPIFHPTYANNALNVNYFGHSILENPIAWQVPANLKYKPDYRKENWRKTSSQTTSTSDTDCGKGNATTKKRMHTQQIYDKKSSLDWNVTSNDSGHESQFKEEKISSFSNSPTSSASACNASTSENNNRTVLFENNDQYDYISDDVEPEYAYNNPVKFPNNKQGYQIESLNKSSKAKDFESNQCLEEPNKDLDISSNSSKAEVQNSDDSKEKTFQSSSDSCIFNNDKSMLSSYDDCNNNQNGLQNNNKNVENLELEQISSLEPNYAEFIDMNSSLPSLIFSVEEITDINIQDSDEAIPDFAINNRVFSIDFPEDTVSFGTKIEPFKMPEDIQVESIIAIYISEIHNAYRFWFHYAVEALDELMHKIELFYAQDAVVQCYKMLPEQIQRGQLCVALFQNAWHRAEILSNIIADKVKVYYLDYGTVSEVAPDELMYLYAEFAEERAYACRGSLAEISPIRLHWSKESTIAFLTMVKNRKLHAKICEMDTENSVYYLQIVDNHTENVIHINRELIRMKHATKCYEWIKSKLTGTARLRHRREEYPTFKMLEDGEYPTFVEIYSMEVNGINYEDMTDKMIYHPSIVDIKDFNNPPFLLLSNNPFKEDIIKELTKTSN